MLTLLPGEESTTWNEDMISSRSLHLSMSCTVLSGHWEGLGGQISLCPRCLCFFSVL